MTGRAGDRHGEECGLCGLTLAGTHIENDAGDVFCCTGCRDVSAALDETPAIDEREVEAALTDRDGREVQADRTGRDDPPESHERVFLRVSGMHCTTCEAFIEAVAAQDGVSTAEASYVTETVRIDYDPDEVSENDLVERLSTGGYTAHRRDDTLAADHAEETALWRLAIGVMLGMWVMMPYLVYIYPVHFSLYPPWMLELARQQLESARYFYYVLFVFTSLVLFTTGGPILRGAYVSLKTRRPNMDLLVSLAAVSAYLYSTLAVLLGRIDIYYDVTVAIVVVVTAGTYYESSIKRKATDLLSEVSTAQVDTALLYRDDGTTTEVDVGDLDADDRVLVRAGDRIPVDGVVCEGEGTVDESVVTGESLPVATRSGDDVVGGSVLTDGAVVVEVGEDAASSVNRITDLIWNLQSSNHGIQKLADRLAVIFVPGVVTLAVVAGAGYLLLGSSVTMALLVALTVLLVSCPCALGLATPLAVASGIREGIEHGIVVFDDTVFERMRAVDVVIFDKTGTLTTGDLRVLEADAPADLLRAAAAVERQSSHPVADTIVDAFGVPTDLDASAGEMPHLTEERLPDGGTGAETGTTDAVGDSAPSTGEQEHGEVRVAEFQNHTRGVEGVVDGSTVLVGNLDLFSERGWTVPEPIADEAAAAREDGRLPVVLGRNGAAAGVVVLGDEPRTNWEETVTALSERGVEIVVLTGDDERAATVFSHHPHVDRVFAGVPPEAKAETVRRLGIDRHVVMVGDGTNDGPALARADLGIALGSGTALAVDAADIAIVDDDLSSIESVFDLATAARRRVKQNIGWAFLYNAIAIPLALLGYLNPLFAAVAMASSSLLVVTNSTRGLLDDDD